MPRRVGNSDIMVADLVVINNLTFCKAHGEEACPVRCQYDFMPLNDYSVSCEEEVMKALEKDDLQLPDADSRRSINCYQLGAIPVDKDDPLNEDCHCSKHKKINCNICFNWAKIFLEQAVPY